MWPTEECSPAILCRVHCFGGLCKNPQPAAKPLLMEGSLRMLELSHKVRESPKNPVKDAEGGHFPSMPHIPGSLKLYFPSTDNEITRKNVFF